METLYFEIPDRQSAAHVAAKLMAEGYDVALLSARGDTRATVKVEVDTWRERTVCDLVNSVEPRARELLSE
jgi:hypothetical protein